MSSKKEKEKETSSSTAPTLNQRFISCLQSTGRVGKSTFAEAFIHWLTFAGVPYSAVDSDAEHKTLSSRNKSIKFFDAVGDRDNFAELIKKMPADRPVIIADFPAQATSFLLENWFAFRVNDIFTERGCRMVNLIFAADDQTALISAAHIHKQFGNSSDYVIVKNPARAKSVEFEKSKLAKALRDTGAPTIELPAITAGSLTAIQDLSRKEGRYVSLSEASESPSVEAICRYELQHFLNFTMTQFEDTAAILLPSVDAIQQKVYRAPETVQSAVNPFDL